MTAQGSIRGSMLFRGRMGFSALAVLCCSVALRGQEPAGNQTADPQGGSQGSAVDSEISEDARVSVDVARDRAKIMHEIYATTLDVMHERYFHGQRAVVPARAMEDVFAEMKRQSQVEARWISVNMKAMSINHEPQSDFEKQAAEQIGAGKSELEVVENGFYRRAGAIPMTGGCISCHEGLFKTPSKKPLFTALVISVPVHSDSGQSSTSLPR